MKVTHNKVSAICISWFVSFAIGIVKEAYDEHKHHNAEESDWIADMVGDYTCLLFGYDLIVYKQKNNKKDHHF